MSDFDRWQRRRLRGRHCGQGRRRGCTGALPEERLSSDGRRGDGGRRDGTGEERAAAGVEPVPAKECKNRAGIRAFSGRDVHQSLGSCALGRTTFEISRDIDTGCSGGCSSSDRAGSNGA